MPAFLRFALMFVAMTSALRAAQPAAIELWPEGVPGLREDAGPEQEKDGRFTNIHFPSLAVYAPKDVPPNGTAVIYAAGGGYVRVATGQDGGKITQWLNSIGITVFVLKYRHAPYQHPAPLRDALRAVRLVRSRADELGVKPNRIGMLGGSAGGHLAASASTLFDAPEGRTGAELDQVSGRPDFLILICPVISMQDGHAHGTARGALLGPEPTAELKQRLSVDEQVTAQTSPTFLVHSAEDRTVHVSNSLLFYQAMLRAKAPIELHLYAKGPHGDGLSPAYGPISEWPRLCESWLRFNGWLPAAP